MLGAQILEENIDLTPSGFQPRTLRQGARRFGTELRGVTATFCPQSPNTPLGNLQLPKQITKFSQAITITYIWLKNHSSRQLWREMDPERAFSWSIPSPHQPREFQNSCEYTGILQGLQVGRACLCQGNGVAKGTGEVKLSG